VSPREKEEKKGNKWGKTWGRSEREESKAKANLMPA
jgi:hypothetical protein